MPEPLFRYLVELEVAKALRLRYRVSLLCLSPDFDGVGARAHALQLAQLMQRHLRRTDVTTALGRLGVGVLLVGAEPGALSTILDRIGTGEPGHPRFLCGPRLVSVSAGGSSYPTTTPTAEGLLHQAIDLMRRARNAGGDRLVLPIPAPHATSR